VENIIRNNIGLVLSDVVHTIAIKDRGDRTIPEVQLLEQQLLRIKFLKQISRDNKLLSKLCGLFEVQRVPAGMPIFTQGQEGDRLFVILQGAVQVRKKSKVDPSQSIKCRSRPVRKTPSDADYNQALTRKYGRFLVELGAGDCFGELALVEDAPRSASAVCTQPTVLLFLTKGNYESTLKEFSDRIIFQPALNKRAGSDDIPNFDSNHSSLNGLERIRGFSNMVKDLPVCNKLIQSIGEDTFQQLCMDMNLRSIPPGHLIAQKGDLVKEVLIVIKGTAKQYISDSDTAQTSGGNAAAMPAGSHGNAAPPTSGPQTNHRPTDKCRFVGRGGVLQEVAVALAATQPWSVKAVDTCVVISIPRYSYRQHWPEKVRCYGMLHCMKKSFAFQHASTKELIGLMFHAQLETYQRGNRIDHDGSLCLVLSGTCKLRGRNGVVVASVAVTSG
jgi:CRP-like cAMP-binding protein